MKEQGARVKDQGGRMKDESRGIPELRKRTYEYAVRIVRLYSALPKSFAAQSIGKQIFRSGTSVGAHYREACRAKSNADFVSKIEGALQELDETAYWLELLIGCEIVKSTRLNPLMRETDELTAIFVTMIRRVKARAKA